MSWFVVAGCLILSFIFSGLEAGLMSVNPVRLHHHARQRNKAALKLERLLAEPDRALLTVLFVTNLLNIIAVVLSTGELVRLLGEAGYIVSLLLWLPLYLFALQLLPKSLFRRFPYRALAAFADLLHGADFLLSPLLRIGSAFGGMLFPKDKRERRKLFVGRDDVKYFMKQSERGGALTAAEHALIHNIVEFRLVSARDVMLPIGKVTALPENASLDELFRLCESSKVDHVPVLDAKGEMEGVVDVCHVLVEQQPQQQRIGFYQRPLIKVGTGEAAANVMRKLRNVRARLAAVVDGRGRCVGVVHLEGIIRKLVAV